MGHSRVFRERAQRRSILRHGQQGTGGRVDPDADDIPGAAWRVPQGQGDTFFQSEQVICRILKRPAKPQLFARRKRRLHNAVGIIADPRRELAARPRVNKQRAGGQGAEIDSDAVMGHADSSYT